jgi:hypothetical protein
LFLGHPLEQRRAEVLKRPFVKMLKVAAGAAMATGRAAAAKTEESFMLGRLTVERKPSHATYECVYFTCLGMVKFAISGRFFWFSYRVHPDRQGISSL